MVFGDPIVQGAVGISAAMFLSLAGAAFGIGLSSPSIGGSMTERKDQASKMIISTVLAEALGIYGLIIAFLGLSWYTGYFPDDVASEEFINGASALMWAGLTMGFAALFAGLAIGYAGSSNAKATAEDPDLFVMSLIPVVLGEALAIYGLIISFLMVSALP
jgi:V-type H+-transporting ATPase proteolipid subunit